MIQNLTSKRKTRGNRRRVVGWEVEDLVEGRGPMEQPTTEQDHYTRG